MDYKEILDKWAVYSEYDANQSRFDLLSMNYHWHKVGNVIKMLVGEYDASGLLGVIYAKKQYLNVLKNTEIPLWDLVTNSDKYNEEKEMLACFMSPELNRAEKEFLDRMNEIYVKMTNGKLLGDDADSREKMIASLEQVAETIKKCNIEVFKKGGVITDVKNISIDLHIFNTLAECLLALEKAEDGMYFCFIRANNTAHCYFSFFIKSNGTILSCNDRTDETYIGQWTNARNGRWSEGKADDIFPYNYIFEYSEHDHKGYATKYEIQEEKFNLCEIGLEGIMPIIIAMMLVIFKVSGKELNYPLHYIDSFLPCNKQIIEKNELMVVTGSELVQAHNQIDLSFETGKVLSGEYAEEFTQKDFNVINREHDYGYFTNKNQLMVELWGQGFEIDVERLFHVNNVKCLMDRSDKPMAYVAEYIGNEKKIRMQVYYEIRKQLASYMRQNIYEAWVAYGRTDAIRNWYVQALRANKENLYRLMSKYQDALEAGEEKNSYGGNWTKTGRLHIDMIVGQKYLSGYFIGNWNTLGVVSRNDRDYDETNGCECNTWFVFKPQNWQEIEAVTGVDVPKILKGWNYHGHSENGNSNLSATDAVAGVGTPFERNERFYRDEYENGAYCDFRFAWGFSKSGWNKIRKELKKSENRSC